MHIMYKVLFSIIRSNLKLPIDIQDIEQIIIGWTPYFAGASSSQSKRVRLDQMAVPLVVLACCSACDAMGKPEQGEPQLYRGKLGYGFNFCEYQPATVSSEAFWQPIKATPIEFVAIIDEYANMVIQKGKPPGEASRMKGHS